MYATTNAQTIVDVELAEGSTVAELLEALRGHSVFGALDLETIPVGIFGIEVGRDHVLEAGDRVEAYRPLLIDPKAERRRRAREG